MDRIQGVARGLFEVTGEDSSEEAWEKLVQAFYFPRRCWFLYPTLRGMKLTSEHPVGKGATYLIEGNEKGQETVQVTGWVPGESFSFRRDPMVNPTPGLAAEWERCEWEYEGCAFTFEVLEADGRFLVRGLYETAYKRIRKKGRLRRLFGLTELLGRPRRELRWAMEEIPLPGQMTSIEGDKELRG